MRLANAIFGISSESLGNPEPGRGGTEGRLRAERTILPGVKGRPKIIEAGLNGPAVCGVKRRDLLEEGGGPFSEWVGIGEDSVKYDLRYIEEEPGAAVHHLPELVLPSVERAFFNFSIL